MTFVGENIDAYCPRCELLLAHVVLFEVKGAVSRVKCRTCKHEHKFKGIKPEKKKTSSIAKAFSQHAKRKPSPEKTANMADIQRWQAKQAQLTESSEKRGYQMSETYKKGDILNHNQFGLGFVEKIISDMRMDVLFRDGVKRMTMNINTTV